MVGLIPLFAVETLEPEVLHKVPGFKRRLEWFIDNRPDLTTHLACMRKAGRGERRLLSITNQDQLRRLLKYMLDEHEFLSPYGVRASRDSIERILTHSTSMAWSIGSSTSRPRPRQGCLVEIPTGAAQSGSL